MRDGCLIPAEVEFNYHISFQIQRHTISSRIKNHENSRIKDKVFRTNSDIQEVLPFKEYKSTREIVQAFKMNQRYEHFGQDTRSAMWQTRSTSRKKLKISDRPRPHELNAKSNLIDLMKDCHNELTSRTNKAPTRGVVIRETPEIPVSKKKEKVDVTRGKGIELLSQVALNEDAQFKEVQRKNMRDFHKNHPSSSGAVKIIPSVTSKGTGIKPEVPDVTEEESSENNENKSDSKHKKDENDLDSKFNQEENEEDEDEEEVVKTPSNNSDDEDETKITDKAEGNEDEEMDYTTDIPTTEAELVCPTDVHVYHEVPSKQTPTLLTVPVLVITDSSLVFSTVISHSLQSFTPPPLLSTPTPPPTTEATNPLSTLHDFASVFQFNNRVTSMEQEVAELKKDPLHTQVMALVDEHLDAKLGATRDEFMNFLSASLTTRIAKQVKDQLP
ncbi:hypothetical protein Tco_0138928 [Tanacetum coccineum]